jgi:regulatory protein
VETRASRTAKAKPAGPTGTAYEAALRFLGHRQRSVSEIHRHLRGKKFDDEAIADAIDKLRAQRYVDDEAFARYWLEQRERFRPRGDRGIRMELAQKGVSRDVIDVVLGERAPDADIEQAKKALTRMMSRWAALTPMERKRKIHTFLAARGFGYGTIEEVIRASVEDIDDEG